MKQVFIPRNNPTIDKRSVKSLATVANERQAALESKAIARHAATRTAQREREVFIRKMLRTIDNPATVEHAVVLKSNAERKAARLAAGKWWREA